MANRPSPTRLTVIGGSGARPPLVLLVERDPTTRQLYTHALETNGQFEVIHAETGEAAVEALNRYSGIECVVSGIELPELDGFEVLRASKVLRPHTPVLLVAENDNPKHAALAVRERADDILTKPVDLDELRVRVAALAARGRQSRVAHTHTVLAVGAHPDDVEIGIAGTLLRHVSRGDRVVHLMMTDGEAGGNKDDRVAEATRSAQMLGVTLIRGQLPDAFLSDARETVSVIARAVTDYNPSVVYVHSVRDGHQDHRATYNATLSASRAVPTLCCYQSPSSTVEFQPNCFIDIGDFLDAKIELINLYRSQTSTRLYLAEDMIRATARYWGRHAAHRLVEPLEVVWQLTA